MEKLKSILKLKFIQEIPREDKMAYLLSVGMGVVTGALMMAILSLFSSQTSFESSLFTFVVIAPSAIATIILLLVLLKKFSIVKEDIKIRFKCIALMLISYIYIML